MQTSVVTAKNSLKAAFSLLERKDQRKYLLILVVQLFLGLLDIAGIALVSVAGIVLVERLQNTETSWWLITIKEVLGIQNFSTENQVIFIGFIATFALTAKTIISIYLTKRVLLFLANKSARASHELLKNVFSAPINTLNSTSVNQLIYSVTGGTEFLIVGLLGTTASIFTDLFLLLLIFFSALFVNPTLTIITFILLGGATLIGFRRIQEQTVEFSKRRTEIGIIANEKIMEFMVGYREAIAHNRRPYYIDKIAEKRLATSILSSKLSFIPLRMKYMMEFYVFVSAFFIAISQFLLSDAKNAALVLMFFLASGSRAAPAVLRLQQNAVAFKSSVASAGPTIEAIRDFAPVMEQRVPELKGRTEIEFAPKIDFIRVRFFYSKSVVPTISDVNFSVDPRSFVAIVGDSGSGKSTILDLVLGLLTPEQGEILISNEKPLDAFSLWPGKISFVPQSSVIVNGTLRENLCLGYDLDKYSLQELNMAIQMADLSKLVASFPRGLDTHLGDRGTRLSGGEKQRIGIARAVLGSPKLLILDEATSALDGKSEKQILRNLRQSDNSLTVLMVAHRLSAIQDFDNIIFLEKGKVLATGKFNEVRDQVPKFDSHARALGL
jgi:ABC-type multidrug transport system fused ATPase/permease subunit